MDQISALLDGPRARGAFVLRSLLVAPWSMEIRDGAPLTLIAVSKGEAWIGHDAPDVRLAPGQVAIVRGPKHYRVSSSPDAVVDIVIHPGQRCETVNGEVMPMSMRLGVRTWGHSIDAPTVMLTGTYEHHSAISSELLDTLPALIVVDRPDNDPLLTLLGRELTNDLPGQQSLLDRLLDALLIDTVRSWYSEQIDAAPAWWTGHRDPIVGSALRLIHDDPQQTWTIGSLAKAIGTSRANLARRFTSIIGEPIMTYLTNWRLGLAADLLTQPGASVTRVAGQVGYGSPYAFSAAFKRRYRKSPNEHRVDAMRAGSPVDSWSIS